MTARLKKILVIEDERPLAHALELKLQSQGHTVVVAHDGQEGVDQIEKEAFNVVLLDLMMPLMDGFQVLERLKDKPEKPVVFVLSNLSQPEDEARVMSLGAHKFFIKSNTPLSEIVDEIDKL